jgi:hypothetical protein
MLLIGEAFGSASEPVRLFVKDVSLKILGKEVTVIAIEKADGTHGYSPKNADGFLQPDLQYVIHPSGTNIANALVLGARTSFFLFNRPIGR